MNNGVRKGIRGFTALDPIPTITPDRNAWAADAKIDRSVDQGTQFDNTFTTSSGCRGSFVFKRTAKLCGPSMPSCIIKAVD